MVSFVLDQAAESNTAEAVSMLLRFGADPFLRNRDGKLPRELTNEPAVLELLREGGGTQASHLIALPLILNPKP